MSQSPPKPKKPGPRPGKDRRAAPGSPGAAGSLRRLRGLISRPLRLERNGLSLRIAFVERRRNRVEDESISIAQLREAIWERLIAQEHAHALQAMRHLVLVHDELGRKGWRGVEGLSRQVMARALAQAEMLVSHEPSPALDQVIERLRLLKVAADLRVERAAALRAEHAGSTPEVSEATHEEYEKTQRVWSDTPATDSPAEGEG